MASHESLPRNRLRTGLPLALLAALFGAPLAEPQPQPVTQSARCLPPGALLQRDLPTGRMRFQRVFLRAGQYLGGVVQPDGVDLAVCVLDPAGRPLLGLDGPGISPEPIAVIAATTGEHRIEVRSAGTARLDGRYRVNLEAPRLPSAADRKRVAAAFQLSAGGRRGLTAEALPELQQSLRLWESLGDARQSAVARFWLGRVRHFQEDYAAALLQYEKALSVFQARGDRLGEAIVLDRAGRSHLRRVELPRAFERFQEALRRFREVDDRGGEADVLSNLAIIHRTWGEVQDALSLYGQALTLWHGLGRESAQAIILYNLGELHLAVGRPRDALDSFRRAFPLQRDGRQRGLTLSGAGEAYAQLKLFRAADFAFRRAIELLRKTGRKTDLVTALSRRGSLYLDMGRTRQALALFEKALRLARAIGDRRGAAVALAGSAQCYNLLGRDAEALRRFEQARSLFLEIGERDAVAATLYRSAQALQNLGQTAAARSAIEQSLGITESLRVEPVRVKLRSSYSALVRARYQLYIDLLMRTGRQALAFEASESARARAILDEIAEAGARVDSDIRADLLALRRDLLGRRRVSEDRRDEWLSAEPSPEARRRLAEIEREIAGLEARYDTVLAEIRKASPRYAALTQPRPLTLAEIQTEVLDGDTLLLSYLLGEPKSYVWLVRRGSIEVRELPARSEIEKIAVRLAKSLARSNRREKWQETREALIASGRMLLGPIAGELDAKRLLIVPDGVLLGIPFAALPDPRAGGQRSGSLFPQPLVASHEIATLPSASLLAMLRRQLKGRRPAPHAVAALADPVFAADDLRVRPAVPRRASVKPGGGGAPAIPSNRLVHTREEAKAILELVPASEGLLFLDFAANLQAATSPRLSRYRFVHFATHGLISESPERTGIVLSRVDEQGRPQGGFLQAADVYALKLPAELVVLSACRTAQGEEGHGDGLGLLTRGFLYAGARRVVVSLWDVDDEATAALMARFYRGMLREGLSPAAALRAAQLSISQEKRWQSPYYWAGFILQGDW